MPCLKIFTNLHMEFVPQDFVQKMAAVLARVLHKPDDIFIVMVATECLVTFAGQSAACPAAVATFESIGNLGTEENKIITNEITTYMDNEMGIVPEYFFLTFYDLCPQDVAKGWRTMI